MTFRPAVRGLAHPLSVLLVAGLFAGCASRPLNVPPVVDRSPEIAVKPAQGTVGTTADGQTQVYTVKAGDTLYSLARRFNTTPSDLANWNNLGADPRLRVDQVIRVSAPGSATPAVASTDPGTATSSPVGAETIESRPIDGPGASTPPVAAPAGNAPVKSGPLGVKRPYSDATLAELSKPDGGAVTTTPETPIASAPATAPASGGVSWAWPSTGKVTEPYAAGKNNGVNIAGKAGDPVLAAADGKVTFAGTGVRGYGNFVIVRHTPDILSVYAHNRVNLVKEGATVTKGQKIAEMGSSDADSVKLHFEIRNDSKPVDPTKFLPER